MFDRILNSHNLQNLKPGKYHFWVIYTKELHFKVSNHTPHTHIHSQSQNILSLLPAKPPDTSLTYFNS